MDCRQRVPGAPAPNGSAPSPPRGLERQEFVAAPSFRRSVLHPPPGFQHAEPGTVLRSRDVELAFLGLIPQRVTATQLLYRTMDMNGAPEATVTTVIVPAERGPGHVWPAAVLPVRDRRGRARCFPSYAMRRRAQGARLDSPVRVPAGRRRHRRGMGGVGARPRGPAGSWGAPYEPGYRVLDGIRAALSSERLGLSPDGAGRAVGLLRRRTGQRVGRRDVRRICARTEHRRRGAGLARRRPRPHLPPAQRHASVRAARAWWWPRCHTSTPTWTG